MRILDIDLDFFLNERYCGKVTNIRRLDSKRYKPWPADKVEEFLEHNCGLNKLNKIPGKYFKHHDELFYFLREHQEKAEFKLKFDIDHVDAHGDLGFGDTSYIYISTELLNKPLEERPYPTKINGLSGLGAGNFLAFLIACQWIGTLRYINHSQWADDIFWFILKDFTTESNAIQLKNYTHSDMNTIVYNGDMRKMANTLNPISYEQEVPFYIIDYKNFLNKLDYDMVFLTHSPGFTPRKSDNLISVIEQYMSITKI